MLVKLVSLNPQCGKYRESSVREETDNIWRRKQHLIYEARLNLGKFCVGGERQLNYRAGAGNVESVCSFSG